MGLLRKGALPNSDYFSREWDGLAPLHRACLNGLSEKAEYLIKFGASLTSTNIKGMTPLHFAASKNSMECVKILMKYNSPIGEPDLYVNVLYYTIYVTVVHL